MLSSLVNQEPNGLVLGQAVTIPTLANLATRGDTLPFKADSFDYLATIMLGNMALVAAADAPYDNIDELVAYSKENGGALIGFDAGAQRLMMLAINKDTGSGFELVSNQSGAEVMKGILGGQLQAGFGAGAHIQYIKSGDMKVLAVATKTRHGYAPEATSFIEQGYPYSSEPYQYIVAPKGLAPNVHAALVKALDDAINSERVADLIGNVMQSEPLNLGPEATEAKLVNGLAEVLVLMEAAGEK